MLRVADKWQRKRRREKERAREGYTGSGTALPQGRTPNLGHNYTEADVARPFPRRRLGAAVTPRDYSRFRNNNYLIPEVYNAQPGWNAGSNRRKERKTGSLSVHLVMLPRAIKMQKHYSLAIFEPRADSLHRKASISRLSIVILIYSMLQK